VAYENAGDAYAARGESSDDADDPAVTHLVRARVEGEGEGEG
jgi:hypothetical protein